MKRWPPALALLVAVPALVVVPAGPAAAATYDPLAPSLGAAMAAVPGTVTGAAYLTGPPSPSFAASSGLATDVALGGFPRQGPTYAVISTARPYDMLTGNPANDTVQGVTDPTHGSKAFDVMVLRVDVVVPAGSNCAAVDLRFQTDEVTTAPSIQDTFVLEVDSTAWVAETAVTTPGAVATISVHSTGVAAPGPSPTPTRDRASQTVTASVPISTGPHSLYFSVFDHVDAFGNTDVLVDNLRFPAVANPGTGCVAGLAGAITNTVAPVVSGRAKVGSTLTASRGTWTPGSGVSFTYQWLRAGAPIAGATSASYVPRPADLGKSLSVRVTATNGSSASATSAGTTAVAKGSLKTSRPKISGTVKVGQKLKAKAGTWGPAPVKLSYRWFRGAKPIKGATSATYTLVGKDRGSRIKVVVKGSKPGYKTVSQTSARTKTVA
jgi:hypothetical protein